MKLGMMYPGLFAGLFIVASTLRCTPGTPASKTAQTVVNDVLPVAQLICVETAAATTLDGIKQVCDGIDKLTPGELDFVLQLLDQKRAAQKMGFTWKTQDDAGTK